MKKIISIFLCVSMLTGTAAITANAATADDASVGTHKYTILDKTTIKDGQIRFYTYNYTENNPKTGIQIDDLTMNISKDFFFNDIVQDYKQINVSGASIMRHWLILENGRGGTRSRRYDETGGTYEKIRVKLSDYSYYFNSDGTHTKDDFNYNFSTQKTGKDTYSSALVFWSGGIFTAVTPNKDGYAEFYVCKNIGEDTRFFADFRHVTPNSQSSGGGKNGAYFYGLTMGDTNISGGVNVDDVTAIQSYAAGTEEFDSLQQRNADVNDDGKIDINDATMIQKYLAGYNV